MAAVNNNFKDVPTGPTLLAQKSEVLGHIFSICAIPEGVQLSMTCKKMHHVSRMANSVLVTSKTDFDNTKKALESDPERILVPKVTSHVHCVLQQHFSHPDNVAYRAAARALCTTECETKAAAELEAFRLFNINKLKHGEFTFDELDISKNIPEADREYYRKRRDEIQKMSASQLSALGRIGKDFAVVRLLDGRFYNPLCIIDLCDHETGRMTLVKEILFSPYERERFVFPTKQEGRAALKTPLVLILSDARHVYYDFNQPAKIVKWEEGFDINKQTFVKVHENCIYIRGSTRTLKLDRACPEKGTIFPNSNKPYAITDHGLLMWSNYKNAEIAQDLTAACPFTLPREIARRGNINDVHRYGNSYVSSLVNNLGFTTEDAHRSLFVTNDYFNFEIFSLYTAESTCTTHDGAMAKDFRVTTDAVYALVKPFENDSLCILRWKKPDARSTLPTLKQLFARNKPKSGNAAADA